MSTAVEGFCNGRYDMFKALFSRNLEEGSELCALFSLTFSLAQPFSLPFLWQSSRFRFVLFLSNCLASVSPWNVVDDCQKRDDHNPKLEVFDE